MNLYKLGWVIVLIAIATTLSSVILEIQSQEPIYFTIMKGASVSIGVGGMLVGLGARRRNRKRSEK